MYHRVFEDLPEIVVKVIRLVVFRIQDSAVSMHIGYKHEDSLEEKKRAQALNISQNIV